jgi:EAL domain-containing protein (putative c-di-GMP-specific phosphodiesterase class I)
MIDPSTTTQDTPAVSSDAASIRRGGLRRLRAGLPLEVSGERQPSRGSPRTLHQFTLDVDRAIVEAAETGTTALLVRAHHRPLPTTIDRKGLGGWTLHDGLASRLKELHPDLMAIGLAEGDIIIFVPGLGRRDDGEQLLVKILDALSSDVIIDDLPYVLEPRIGGALLDSENPSAELLHEAAELALKEANASQHHVLFHSYQRARAEQQGELAQALRSAILEHELSVALQPAIDLTTGAIIAVEAFARWDRPGHGPVAAPDLIDIAASLGVLNRVGEQVLQKAIFHVSDLVDGGVLDDVTLWLNMTASDVLDSRLIRTIQDGARLNRRVKVGIELGPSSSPDSQAVASTLRALAGLGVRTAIGDLGVGFASFAEIRHLPFDSVKLDRSLMTQISTDPAAADVVRHLIGIAAAIGLEPTAQGIEQPDQLELVRSMGCRIAQGFVFTEPLTPEEFATFTQTWDPTSIVESLPVRD